jgi:hypothetical protein
LIVWVYYPECGAWDTKLNAAVCNFKRLPLNISDFINCYKIIWHKWYTLIVNYSPRFKQFGWKFRLFYVVGKVRETKWKFGRQSLNTSLWVSLNKIYLDKSCALKWSDRIGLVCNVKSWMKLIYYILDKLCGIAKIVWVTQVKCSDPLCSPFTWKWKILGTVYSGLTTN